jgi:hypothetical protein
MTGLFDSSLLGDRQSGASADPYDSDPLIQFARSLPQDEDPLLRAFDSPPPEPEPTGPVHHLIPDPEPPGVLSRIGSAFTRNDTDVKGALDAAGDVAGKDVFAGAQGLGGSFNSLTRNTMEGIGRGAVPYFADKVANALSNHPSDPVRTWWWKNMVDPLTANETAFQLGPDASTSEKVAHALGSTLGMISQAVITGGEAAAPEAVATTGQVVRGAVQQGVQSMSVPAISDAVDVGRNVYQQTGDADQAVKAAQVSYLTTVAGGILPLSKPGNVLTRAGTGAASGVVTGELARTSQNALLPEGMQTPFSAEDAAIGGLTGAVMGAVAGPRAPDLERLGQAISQASSDAARAQDAAFNQAMASPAGHLESMPRYQELYNSATASTPEEKASYARQTLANELGQTAALRATAAAIQPALAPPFDVSQRSTNEPGTSTAQAIAPDIAASGSSRKQQKQAAFTAFTRSFADARAADVPPEITRPIAQAVATRQLTHEEGAAQMRAAIAAHQTSPASAPTASDQVRNEATPQPAELTQPSATRAPENAESAGAAITQPPGSAVPPTAAPRAAAPVTEPAEQTSAAVETGLGERPAPAPEVAAVPEPAKPPEPLGAQSDLDFKGAFKGGKNGYSQDLRDQMFAAFQRGSAEAVRGVPEPTLKRALKELPKDTTRDEFEQYLDGGTLPERSPTRSPALAQSPEEVSARAVPPEAPKTAAESTVAAPPEPTPKPVTPQVPNEPGAKYVLPTFATHGLKGEESPLGQGDHEQRVVEAFKKRLSGDEPPMRSIIEARQIYKRETGKTPEGPEVKRVDELLERAVVGHAREIVASAPDVHHAFDKLRELYDRQPKLSTRTSTSIADQAYSTPAPLAYVASHLAGIDRNTKVYEPTAGNGMLLIGADPAKVTANELNPGRAESLRQQGFKPSVGDALDPANQPAPRSQDVVIANPPFGAVRGEDGQSRTFSGTMPDGSKLNTTNVDFAIAARSLDAMKDDGRAVLIIGGIAKTAQSEAARSDAYNGSARRKFFYNLYKNYNVTDHFTVSGDLYAKQGAAWPVDVIAIDGRGKSSRALPAVDVPRVYNSWGDLKSLLDEGHVERRGNAETDRLGAEHAAGVRDDLGNPVRTGAEPAAAAVPRAPGRPNPGAGESVPQSGSSDTGTPAGPAPRGTIPGPGVHAPGASGESVGLNERGDAREAGQPEPAPEPAAAPERRAGGEGSNPQRPVRPADEAQKLGLSDQPAAVTDAAQVTYKPASNAPAVGTLVPAGMQTAVRDSLGSLVNRLGPLNHYVAGELGYKPGEIGKYFSGEQVDALSLALDQMDRGAGFIIGDQTGVGKGRVVAGVIRFALKKGLTPIFVTEKPNLYADMYRDLRDIGQKDVRPLMTNAGEEVPLDESGKVTLKSPAPARHNADLTKMAAEASLGDHNIVFTTYNQMQTLKGELTARQRFLQAMAPNSVVIFDESHNAGGNDAGQRARKGEEGKTGRAGFARTLAGAAKSVFYSSATYAKRPSVMDLYFKTDMSKAVEGNVKKLPDTISAGGVPLQQVVAAMLTKAGQYIRRERSFEGVEYSTPVVPVDRQAAEGISSVMLGVKEFDDLKEAAVDALKQEVKAEASTILGDNAVGRAGVESTNFTSIMHNVIDQMLLALKAHAAADRAIEALKRGEKPVITVANTMGSFLQDYAETAGLKGGDAIGLNFGDLLKRYLDRSRYVRVKDAMGGSREHYLTDEALGAPAVSKFKEVLQAIGNAVTVKDVPVSPIDWIHHRLKQAGYTSSEITGRTHTVQYGSEGAPVYRVRPGKETSIAGRRKVITDFNSGRLDAVVLNQAGSTGLSLHASEKFADQRRRRMIIAQAEKNIDTHMQMLGRVHRTGQVIAPAYDQLVADVPAEKRPAAVLAKKMASLNANTTASRSSQFTSKDSVDFLNHYGDEVAAQLMEDMPEVHARLGSPLKSEDRGLAREDAARRVTGRIPLLPVHEQEMVYDLLESGYKEAIARADALGENALEAKTLPLDAKTVSRQELFAGKPGDDSPFAAGAYADTIDAKRIGKPYTADQVREMVAEKVGGKGSIEELEQLGVRKQSELMTEVRDEYQKYRTDEEAKMFASEMPDAAREGRLGMLDGAMARWRSIMQAVHLGGQYELTLPDKSTLYGVVTDIRRKNTVKMPVAGGAWSVQFAVADGTRTISLPLSKLAVGARDTTNESAIGIERRTRNPITGSPVMKMFDEGQSTTREQRVVVNGNLLAGYSKVGRGQIISYTTHEGRLEQGILMPRNFDLKQFAEEQPVELRPDQLGRFFDRANNGIVETGDGALQIKQHGNDYLISTARSKAEGGKYFLDPGLRNIVGDFTSRGDSMQARVDADTMERAARYLQSNLGEKLRTQSYKDEARAVGGTSFAGPPAKVFSRGASAGSAEAATVRTWLSDATRAVGNAANVHVVDDVAALRERLGQADIPEDTHGVYITGGKDVYLVADQLGDKEKAERKFVHEVFGHLAMEKYADMDRAVSAVTKLNEMGSRSIGKLWDEVARDQPGLDTNTHAKEVIALMAERGAKNAIMDRMVAAARGLLRKMGVKLEYSEGEVRQLIASAARALREDAQRLSPADDIYAHAADVAYRRGDDEALGEALGKMSIARDEPTGVLAKENVESSDERPLEDALAQDLVGAPRSEASSEPSNGSVLYARKAKEDPEITALRRRVMANAVHEGLLPLERLRGVFDRVLRLPWYAVRQGLIDSFASIARYEKLLNEGKLLDASVSPYKQTVATQNLPSVMTAILHTGVPVWKDGTYVKAQARKGVLQIFGPLVNHKQGNLLPQWELYAAARRAARLITEQNPDGSSREKLFSAADIARAVALEEQHPEFRKVFEDWQTFNGHVLDMAQEAGLIDPESRAIWERNDYVPFHRAIEAASGRVSAAALKKAIANQRANIRTLHGSENALTDVFESMLMNTAHLVDASFKNRAAQTIVTMFDGAATSPVAPDAQAVRVDIGQVRRALDAAGITLQDKLTPEQNAQWVKLFRPVKPAGDNIVTVMFGGKPKYYEVHDPLLYQSITQMSPNESLRFLDQLGLTLGKRLLTRAATATPSFMLRNWIRDTQSTWVQNHVGLKPLTSAISGFRAYLKDHELVRDMMLTGAGGDAMFDLQPKNLKKNLKKKLLAQIRDEGATVLTPRKAWHVWLKLQQASENANRIAVYKASRAQGLSHAEAAYRAHDVLNFQQHGGWTAVQALTRMVPFLNARLQGLDRLGRSFGENHRAFLLKGAFFIAATVALMAVNANDRRYQELEEWDRDAFWHFWAGNLHVKIPKGFEIGALFGTLPERAGRLFVTGDDTARATWGSIENMFLNTFAFNPLPVTGKLALEDVTNHDFFTGRPIVGDALKEELPPLQAQPWTSPTLVALAKAMPAWMPDSMRSPLKLEHWIRGYTSAVGMFATQTADTLTRAGGGYPNAPSKPWYESLPGNLVSSSTPRNTKWTGELYRMLEESNATAKSVRDYAKQGQYQDARELAQRDNKQLMLQPALNALAKRMRELNQMARQIENSRTIDADRKAASLDRINETRNKLARQVAPFTGLF